ncbi:Rab6A-Gef Complex Partner Protein 2 [Manis pentadactyla]|nr:Rab6A-Gef Complex Partner Protein 2 [Manis pentadactyla]
MAVVYEQRMGLMAQEQQLGMGLAQEGDGGEACLQEVLSVQTLMQWEAERQRALHTGAASPTAGQRSPQDKRPHSETPPPLAQKDFKVFPSWLLD